MLILVTNDDGIHSPGIQVLADRLSRVGRVVVIAPDRERSAAGHSMTLHSPLRAEEIRPNWFAVDGTPTDCVHLGIHGLLDQPPTLVVSGINRGGNMGDDITYSGTVSAAMEATLMGVPALGVSLESSRFQEEDFAAAGDFSATLAQHVIRNGLPSDTFLNVNVPAGSIAGVHLTRQGKRIYQDVIIEKLDPRGKKYYWIGGGDMSFEDLEGTDFHAVHNGYVSITPLHLDLTNYHSFANLEAWDWTFSIKKAGCLPNSTE